MKERNKFLAIIAVFLGAYFIPFDSPVLKRSALEAFMMLREYARAHVLLCLVPAFFIAGAIANFVSRRSVIKYFGAISGALMYFATLTEVPILQGLIGSGMGKGPALALLLAGPALSLPNMLVIKSIIGTKKRLFI